MGGRHNVLFLVLLFLSGFSSLFLCGSVRFGHNGRENAGQMPALTADIVGRKAGGECGNGQEEEGPPLIHQTEAACKFMLDQSQIHAVDKLGDKVAHKADRGAHLVVREDVAKGDQTCQDKVGHVGAQRDEQEFELCCILWYYTRKDG